MFQGNVSAVLGKAMQSGNIRRISQTESSQQFLDEILTNVYVAAHDKRSPDAINDAVLSIQDRMATWQSTKLSSNLLLNVHELPDLCPPPHIIHFK